MFKKQKRVDQWGRPYTIEQELQARIRELELSVVYEAKDVARREQRVGEREIKCDQRESWLKSREMDLDKKQALLQLRELDTTVKDTEKKIIELEAESKYAVRYTDKIEKLFGPVLGAKALETKAVRQ